MTEDKTRMTPFAWPFLALKISQAQWISTTPWRSFHPLSWMLAEEYSWKQKEEPAAVQCERTRMFPFWFLTAVPLQPKVSRKAQLRVVPTNYRWLLLLTQVLHRTGTCLRKPPDPISWDLLFITGKGREDKSSRWVSVHKNQPCLAVFCLTGWNQAQDGRNWKG